MKIILFILFIMAFIGPAASVGMMPAQEFKEAFLNYLTSFDRAFNYLSDNVEFIADLKEMPYKNTYDKIIEDRVLVKHFVSPGETLDFIIKQYNSNVEDLNDFRKLVLHENPDIVSSDYSLKSGVNILVPSER